MEKEITTYLNQQHTNPNDIEDWVECDGTKEMVEELFRTADSGYGSGEKNHTHDMYTTVVKHKAVKVIH